MSSTVRYTVTPASPAAHLFEVLLEVDAIDGEVVLRLPTWIPGSYMIREFAKNLVAVHAADDRGPVAIVKTDKATWRTGHAVGTLRVTTTVYAWDLSVRAAHLDDTHAFFNGTSLFLQVEGRTDAPHELTLKLPDAHPDWRVATTLPRVSGDAWGPGTFRADSYDALIDHPVELGTFSRVTFDVCGVPHHMVITGRHRCDLDRLARDLTRVCAAQVAVFGDRPPFDTYLFMTMAVGDGYGGLEHRDSTALICRRDDLPQPGATDVSDGYRDFLGLCSHEYFHAWNVKRLKPAAYRPYDLTREGYTRLLWVFEGLTSYYDDLGVLRSGCIDVASWLEVLGRTTTAVWRTAGRRTHTLAEASHDAWIKYYRQDENTPNAQVSYYQKGALVGLALDLTLQRATQGRVTLDDLMRAAWSRYATDVDGHTGGLPEDHPGGAPGGFEALASELAGADLSPFFDAMIRGTEDPPLADLLADVGIRMHTRPATGDADRGGKPAPLSGTPGDLGATVVRAGDGARLKHVHAGGAALAAGLSADDVVVALDGLRVSGAELTSRVRALGAGTRVRVHAFRRDELVEVQVVLGAPPATTVWFDVDPEAGADVDARRHAWLAGRGA